MGDDNSKPVPVDVQNLPLWLKAAVYLGVPSVIALFLVYSLTVQMNERLATLERIQALNRQSMETLTAQMGRIERLLVVTCLASAHQDAENTCLRVREP